MAKFQLHGMTKLSEDKCFRNDKKKQNEKFGKYRLQNFLASCKSGEKSLDLCLDQPQLLSRDGVGWNRCEIDIDSQLRNGDTLTNKNCIHHLLPRSHATTPFLARGNGDLCLDKELRAGKLTNFGRVINDNNPCLNRFVPQIPSVRKNIQNVRHLIPEMNNSTWKRGGEPSRQTYRDQCNN